MENVVHRDGSSEWGRQPCLGRATSSFPLRQDRRTQLNLAETRLYYENWVLKGIYSRAVQTREVEVVQ